MEKAFRIEKGSKYDTDLRKYIDNTNSQAKFVKEFFKTHNIETSRYYVGANGSVNKPFEEYNKDEIVLGIIATEQDKINFGKMLCKETREGMFDFRKKSKVNKEFQDHCIENQVIINLSEPDLRDYFKSMDWKGYGRSLFKNEDIWYLKTESELLKDNDIPEGFIEIKLSEFYSIKDKMESEDK